jgi:hypothetical protein
MDDREFDGLIDARFPYGDEAEWKRLIDLGRSISPNAHFITLCEIARPPRGAEVTSARQAEMVRHWVTDFEHPLKELACGFAIAQIEGRKLPVDYVLRVMDEIAHHHKGQWGVLSLALTACDDVDDLADTRYDAIKSAWENDG